MPSNCVARAAHRKGNLGQTEPARRPGDKNRRGGERVAQWCQPRPHRQVVAK